MPKYAVHACKEAGISRLANERPLCSELRRRYSEEGGAGVGDETDT